MPPSFRTVKFYAKNNKNRQQKQSHVRALPPRTPSREHTRQNIREMRASPHLTAHSPQNPSRWPSFYSRALSLSCFLPFDRGAVSCAHDLLARRAVPSAFKHKHDSLINAMNLTFFFPSLRTSSAEWVPRGHSNKKKSHSHGEALLHRARFVRDWEWEWCYNINTNMCARDRRLATWVGGCSRSRRQSPREWAGRFKSGHSRERERLVLFAIM